MKEFIRSLARDFNKDALEQIAKAAETYHRTLYERQHEDEDDLEDEIEAFAELAHASRRMLKLSEPEVDYIVEFYDNTARPAGEPEYLSCVVTETEDESYTIMKSQFSSDDSVVRAACWKREDGKPVSRVWEITKG